ncbi:MAG: hypothetical protein ACXWLR_01665, partial [Myxococcales bacterium]
QPVGTVVAFGAAPTLAAGALDAATLSCDILPAGGDLFARLKRANGGSLLLLLAGDSDDPALAAATKAARILRRRGGGEAVLVLPAVPALPGPQARTRLERAAALTGSCVVQPVARASWADAVRCFLEPLAVFGLVGVESVEVRGLLRPRAALLHLWEDEALDRSLRDARDVLVSCRLRPSATLHEVDAAAWRVRSATDARLVLAGPEVGADEGPTAIAAVLL